MILPVRDGLHRNADMFFKFCRPVLLRPAVNWLGQNIDTCSVNASAHRRRQRVAFVIRAWAQRGPARRAQLMLTATGCCRLLRALRSRVGVSLSFELHRCISSNPAAGWHDPSFPLAMFVGNMLPACGTGLAGSFVDRDQLGSTCEGHQLRAEARSGSNESRNGSNH